MCSSGLVRTAMQTVAESVRGLVAPMASRMVSAVETTEPVGTAMQTVAD